MTIPRSVVLRDVQVHTVWVEAWCDGCDNELTFNGHVQSMQPNDPLPYQHTCGDCETCVFLPKRYPCVEHRTVDRGRVCD